MKKLKTMAVVLSGFLSGVTPLVADQQDLISGWQHLGMINDGARTSGRVTKKRPVPVEKQYLPELSFSTASRLPMQRVFISQKAGEIAGGITVGAALLGIPSYYLSRWWTRGAQRFIGTAGVVVGGSGGLIGSATQGAMMKKHGQGISLLVSSLGAAVGVGFASGLADIAYTRSSTTFFETASWMAFSGGVAGIAGAGAVLLVRYFSN
ncbi:MAG: hypothetical protein HYT79_02205 [Elusimicrobia bacterium]|nr:hypothetical protein [Elusimicrobiota bacterium]